MRYGSALATLAAVLAFAAAGCGGGDDNGGEGAKGNEDVSGSISTMAIWAGQEQKSFQAVIDAFKEKYPNVNVKYTFSTITPWPGLPSSFPFNRSTMYRRYQCPTTGCS